MTKLPTALQGPFDQAKLDEKITERDAKLAAVEESGKKLDEMFQKTQGDQGKGFTAEEQQTYNNMAVNHKNLETSYNRAEKEVELMSMRDPAQAVERDENATDQSELLEQYLRAETNERASQMLRSDDFTGFRTGNTPGGKIPADTFNLSQMAVRSDDSSGEEAVDSTTYRGIIDRLLEYGGAQQMAYAFSTSTGEDFIVPRADNTAQKGRRLADQASTVNTRDTNDITSVTIGAETLTSDRVIVTNEMIQDAVFDIVGWVERSLVRRIGRTKNDLLTKSVSGSAFTGVASVAKTGIDAGTPNAVTYSNLVDLIYSVDPAYRLGGESGLGGFMKPGMGNTGFQMHETVEKTLMKLVDNEGRPLWNLNTRTGQPNFIVGYPYVVNQSLDAMGTADNEPLLFGCFEYMWTRNVSGLAIHNFWDSNTADTNSRHIFGFHRTASQHTGPEQSAGVADAIAKLII